MENVEELGCGILLANCYLPTFRAGKRRTEMEGRTIGSEAKDDGGEIAPC